MIKFKCPNCGTEKGIIKVIVWCPGVVSYDMITGKTIEFETDESLKMRVDESAKSRCLMCDHVALYIDFIVESDKVL